MTSTALGRPAIFLEDALTNLGIVDPQAPERLACRFDAVLATLHGTGPKPADNAWYPARRSIGLENEQDMYSRRSAG